MEQKSLMIEWFQEAILRKDAGIEEKWDTTGNMSWKRPQNIICIGRGAEERENKILR